MQCASHCFCQVLESFFCYVWILSCDGFPLLVPGLGLAAPRVAAAGVLGIQGIKPGVAQLNRCKAVLQWLSCPSQPSLADRAMPL